MDNTKKFEATSMPDRDWWSALWPDPRAVVEGVGVKAGQAVVDLCCGDGYFTLPIADLTGTEVAAIELDPEMLKVGKAAAKAADAQQISWICGDAMRLDQLVRAPVDLVFIANTLHGAPDKEGLAHVVRRTLQSEGRFVVVNWWPRPRAQTTVLGKARGPRDEMRFSPEQVLDWLAPAGFQLDGVHDVSPYHYAAIFSIKGA